ncbi:hypothetical protein TW65_08171 [Stemphylium lycopersici]|nr:hypothetical protein TW65_08171 [Stemphylium lycopersici]
MKVAHMPSLSSDEVEEPTAQPTGAPEQGSVASESSIAPQRTPKRIQREPAFPEVVHEYAFFPLGANSYITNESQLQLPKDDTSARSLLFRTLIDIFVFSYDVDPYELHFALAECVPILRAKKLSTSQTTLLSAPELRTVIAYADAIHNVCSNVLGNSQSLLKDDDGDFIVRYVLKPAQDLHIDPAYLFDHLMAFRLHRCHPENRKKTLLYKKTSSIWACGLGLLPAKWNADRKQKLLAYWLVSDDIALARLRPHACERLRLVIGGAIKRFAQKHCKLGMGSVRREVYAEPTTATLVRQLVLSESMKARRLRHYRAHGWTWSSPSSSSSSTGHAHGPHPPPQIQHQHAFYPPHRSRSNHLPPSSSTRSLCAIHEHEVMPRRPQSASGIRSQASARYSQACLNDTLSLPLPETAPAKAKETAAVQYTPDSEYPEEP